jgi:hypothetical protein
MKIHQATFALGMFLFSQLALAGSIDLDKLETCKTSHQVENAKVALKWIAAYNDLTSVSGNFTDMRTQRELFSEDFNVWHASLAGLAAFYKGTPVFEKLPFQSGQLDSKNYVMSVAFIAYANDLSKNKVIPKRVDCIKNNSVAVDIDFSGYQVKRDAEGYIQYEVEYHAPISKIFVFDQNHRVKQQSVILDSNTSNEVRARLQKKLKEAADYPEKFPPMVKNEKTKGTLMGIYERLNSEWNKANSTK